MTKCSVVRNSIGDDFWHGCLFNIGNMYLPDVTFLIFDFQLILA